MNDAVTKCPNCGAEGPTRGFLYLCGARVRMDGGATESIGCLRRQLAATNAKAEKMAEALEGMIDNEPCRYDHHGNCQTHRLNNPCEVAIARAALDDWAKP